MKKKQWKRLACVGTAMLMAMSVVGCGGSSGNEDTKESKENTQEVAFQDLKLGEDYKDLEADLKFVTHRTDLVDTTFQEYIEEFQKLYPNINITYEGITNYAEDIMTRLTTGDWGDICMIPTTIDKDELENYFVSFGKTEDLEKKYIMLNNFSYEGNTYGIPSVGNAQGIVYNKKVFEEAGIKEKPKTPDEFLDALQKIKDKTDAIPMYTNFAAGWTMSAWDAYISGSATGDPDFTNEEMVHGTNPFAKREDLTGPYAVYYVLYEAVARGLIEDDPTTTDWEGSKGMLNKGEIGTMVLGSWAVSQIQEAGDNSDDVGYMTFPITVDGKQYATAGPDYNYAININSSEDNQIAAQLYIKWLTEESNFAYDQGGIPIVEGEEYPDVYKEFDGIELVIDNPAKEGEEDLYTNINNESELGLNSSPDDKNNIVECALSGSMTLDEIMDEWNERWTAAQEKYGALEE